MLGKCLNLEKGEIAFLDKEELSTLEDYKDAEWQDGISMLGYANRKENVCFLAQCLSASKGQPSLKT